MTEWKVVKLSDLGRIVGGATPSTSREDYYNGDIPWITPKDLAGHSGRYISHGERNITDAGLDSCSTKIMPKNTVLFSSRAPIGYLAIAENDICTNQGFKSIVPNDDVNCLFLYYLLKYNKNKIESLGSGTTFKEVSGATMQNIEVRVPESVEVQEKIASILDAIDSKIENNECINNNLEKQAELLFSSWFFEYRPWGGKIPSNWVQGKLGDYTEIKRGGSPRPIQDFLSDTGLRWLKISDVSGLSSPYILDIKERIKEAGLKKTVYLKAGALVLSNSATPGIPKILDVDSCIHDGWLYFPNSQLSNYYLYLFFKHIRKQLVNLSNGSVFNNLKTDILKNYPVLLPDTATLSQFDDLSASLFIAMREIAREQQKLSILRETVLPKLFSGEIDVSDMVV